MADDILMLRRYAFPDGIRTCEDALTLLALNDACPDRNPGWDAYFVENLAGFLVYHSQPTGVIDEAKAGWLMRTIAMDGAVRTRLELEFMLHAMEMASEVPESLSAFALDQIRLALEAEARGAYLVERPQSLGIVQYDLAYIWRILRGAMDRGRLMLSPLEAVVLREIDRLAAPAASHDAWRDMMAAVILLERPRESLRNSPWLLTRDRQRDECAIGVAA